MIKSEAYRLGFDACGMSKAESLKLEASHLKTWLKKRLHGEMGYMSNYFEKRIDPIKLIPGTKSVISLLLNYHTSEKQEDSSAPIISAYAYGRDYHKVIRKKLKQLFQVIKENIPNVNGRVFVDSAPVLERAWAARAGLGWIGKNSMLISPKFGSFVFIGTILTDLELEYDSPMNEMCGGCTKCLTGCPTRAIIRPKIVDGRKCISYYTIEYKGVLPEKYRNNFHNRVFGCDICQDVCPWNRKIPEHKIKEFEPKKELMKMTKEDWTKLDEERYNRLFEGSAMKRVKYLGLKRNIDFVLQ